MKSEKRRGFFSRLGGVLDATRRWTLNLLFLLLIGLVIYSFVGARPQVPDGGVLVLAPQGRVVDELSAVDLLGQLSAQGRASETLLRDLIDAVNSATDDPRIEVLLLHLDELSHIGISNTLELAPALAAFRDSGKTVVAVASDYDQDSYLLAAQADQIFVHDMGGVHLEGFAVVRNYFRRAIDKLKVNFHVFKVGSFKSALEPFMRDDMSQAAKEANQAWLAQLWNLYREQVIARRGLTAADFDHYVNHVDQVLAEHDGDAARAALEYGLIDGVVNRPKLRSMLMERVGEDEEGNFKQIHFYDYLALTQPLPLPSEAPVGLIVASGNIVDGDQPAGMIGGESLARLLSQARRDDSVKAVVLRIDSGGGSAFASEQIRAELEQLQLAGKPVVVSMGSVAASGAYWIAAGADEIWASPATLTGSIGIFGAFPTFERLLQQLGISTDGIGTTQVAGRLRADLPLDPVLARAIQSSIEYGYRRFIDVVAQGRGKLPTQVKAVAEGRVWSGIDAQQLGLVDKLGSLDEALRSAALLAGLEGAEHRELRLPRTPQEELLHLLSGMGLVQGALLSEPVSSLLNSVLPSWRSLSTLSDPRGIYAYCPLCVAP